LDVAAAELGGIAFAQFNAYGVAHIGDNAAARIEDLADEVEFRCIGASTARRGDFRSGYFYRPRHKELVANQPEIIDLERQRQVGDGIAQQERLLELPLLVGRVEL